MSDKELWDKMKKIATRERKKEEINNTGVTKEEEFFKIAFIVMFIIALFQGIFTHGVATDALNTVRFYEARMKSLENERYLSKEERKHLYLLIDYLEHHR